MTKINIQIKILWNTYIDWQNENSGINNSIIVSHSSGDGDGDAKVVNGKY